MVGNQTGKKGKKKKGSNLEKDLDLPGSAGSGKKKNKEVKRTSSELNNSGSDYVMDDSSSDSGGKTKSHKQKGKNKNDKVIPPEIDLTGLPKESTKSAPTHYTRSHGDDPEELEKSKSDQDAEDTHTYDLLQVEIIDVDTPKILDEQNHMRIEI